MSQRELHQKMVHRLGLEMVTSIISSITEIPVSKDVAMTGEITLRGLVLPIGGLKEKLLAAHRAGIKKVLIPVENKKDLMEVPKTILENIEIIPVKNVDEVIKIALTKPLKRVEWVEVDQISKKEKEELSRH
jgi:ATP-dependent Lon protease, bacterial type